MVKITNGTNVIEVTAGAFDSIYSPQGFIIIKPKKVDQKLSEGQEVNPINEEDEEFCQTLLSKPIGQWSNDEVKDFAEIKGIALTGTKSAKQAKEVIKNFINKKPVA